MVPRRRFTPTGPDTLVAKAVDACRDRLEADGAKSWLWEALSEAAPR